MITFADRTEAKSLHEGEKRSLGCFWSQEAIEKLLIDENALYLTAKDENNVLQGGISAISVCGEWQIINLWVDPDHRRKNVGSALLSALFDQAQSGDTIFLEVAERNQAAINLYEKLGFVRCGHRKNFYPDDNAVLMSYTI